MRIHLWKALLAGVLGAAGLATGLALWSTPSPTRGGSGPAADQPPAVSVYLPLTHVHLFSSGVGYFQREGVVEGNARVDLTFPVNDVNDLLKSMILQDLDGGRISAVGYDSHDPADRTLRGFAGNLTGNPSYRQLLNQTRREKVEVALLPSAATTGTLTGTIVGVEKQTHAAGKGPVVETDR